MHINTVPDQFTKVLVDYEVNGVMHHELRTINHVSGLDDRMSDHKFPDANYPMTFIPAQVPHGYKLEIARAKKSDNWNCVSRTTHKVMASFADFNDALEYVKTHN